MTTAAVALAAVAAWLSFRPPAARPSRRVRIGGAAVVAALPVLMILPAVPRLLVPAAALAAVAGVLALAWATRARAKTAEAHRARVLESCELLAAELLAGSAPGPALARAALAWPLLAPAASANTLGADVAATLRALAATPGAEYLRLLAAAWTVGQGGGHQMAHSVGAIADRIRALTQTRRVIEGELASARATARLLAALPFLVLLIGGGSGAAWRFLLIDPLGQLVLVAGLGLELLGLWWLERIAAGAVR